SLVVERHRQRQREGGSSFVAVDGEQNAELADAGELLPHRDEAFLNEGAKLLFASGVNLALEKSLADEHDLMRLIRGRSGRGRCACAPASDWRRTPPARRPRRFRPGP